MFGANSNTGGGLFGSSNNNNSSSGGLFGNKPASTSGFGFGQSQQPQQSQQSTGFGQSNTTTGGSTGGLFGQPQNNTTSNSTTGGLFGSNPQKSGSTGGLFGSSSNSNTGTGFGANTSGGSLFGKSAAPATGGGLFGNNNNQQSNTTTGGLFGNNQQQQLNTSTTGGLFGNNQQTSNNTGGLFGQSNTNTGTTGGLFGNKPASAGTGTGLFGSSNNTTQTGGGLFGNKPSTNTTGGLFSNQQQQQSQQQPQQSSLFSSNTTNNQQPSFSWSQPQQNQPVVNNTSSLFGFNQNTNQPQTNQNTYTPAINDQLTKVWEQWDPNSPKCALKTHFYNKFNDQEINQLLSQPRPSNETAEDWDKAMIERPNGNSFPIKITSYDEVAQRIETQLDYISKEKTVLNQINERLNNLSAKHDLENTTRILKAKARHTQLSRRLLRLATILAILKLKGYPLLPEEEEIARQFDILTNKINDPNSPIGKLSDIFAKLNILKERAEDLNSQFDQSMHVLNGTLDNGSLEQNKKQIVTGNNNDIIEKFTKILMKQQIGLNYLNDVLEKDFDRVDKSLGSKK
ncbi:NUP57 [Candida jiufengensis]|uniref:NUP57 n=1 Tax=Candida jiufengensis TaxID=497108 RepID=UPI0022242D61|nr:NUP57 [Candida jiufengensis]KAI5950828.1 NUP57 [Candida jiufengensis]